MSLLFKIAKWIGIVVVAVYLWNQLWILIESLTIEQGGFYVKDSLGHNLNVYCEGPENGERILFNTGGSGFSITSISILREHSKLGFRICMIDRYGYGWSDLYKGGNELTNSTVLGKMYFEVATAMGWFGKDKPPVNLMGYSYGGAITGDLLGNFDIPNLNKVVLHDPFVYWDEINLQRATRDGDHILKIARVLAESGFLRIFWQLGLMRTIDESLFPPPYANFKGMGYFLAQHNGYFHGFALENLGIETKGNFVKEFDRMFDKAKPGQILYTTSLYFMDGFPMRNIAWIQNYEQGKDFQKRKGDKFTLFDLSPKYSHRYGVMHPDFFAKIGADWIRNGSTPAKDCCGAGV